MGDNKNETNDKKYDLWFKSRGKAYLKDEKGNYYISNGNDEYKPINNYLESRIESRLTSETNSSSINSTILDEEFKYVIQEKLSLLSKKYEHIILFAGAGASVVNGEKNIDNRYGKTMAQISNEVYEKLNDESVFTLCELVNKYGFKINSDGQIVKGTLEVSKDNKSIKGVSVDDNHENFDLEELISTLYRRKPFVDKSELPKYQNTLDKILEIIVDQTTYKMDEDGFFKNLQHLAIINHLSKKLQAPNRLAVVTTNYDLLFEEAAEQGNYIVVDGFNFGRYPKFDSSYLDIEIAKQSTTVKTKELDYFTNTIELLKVHGSNDWFKVGDSIRKSNINIKDHTDHIDSLNNRVMIFPRSDKYSLSYEEPYFELFTRFQNLLRQSNTLLITTGFSFSDDHIYRMIRDSIKNNNSLTTLITDYKLPNKNDDNNFKQLIDLSDKGYPVYALKSSMNGDLIQYIQQNFEGGKMDANESK